MNAFLLFQYYTHLSYSPGPDKVISSCPQTFETIFSPLLSYHSQLLSERLTFPDVSFRSFHPRCSYWAAHPFSLQYKKNVEALVLVVVIDWLATTSRCIQAFKFSQSRVFGVFIFILQTPEPGLVVLASFHPLLLGVYYDFFIYSNLLIATLWTY